jgi:formylmethanofuran dehydrogenase subunit E
MKCSRCGKEIVIEDVKIMSGGKVICKDCVKK